MGIRNNLNNIFLIGFSGSGKSKIGKILSRSLSYKFIDTDRYIEHIKKKKVHEIINDEGELSFRNIETEILHNLEYTKNNLVVSTGGGIPTIEQNNKIMKRSGIIIWLYASLEIIKYRLNKTKEIRPLLGNNLRSEKVEEMFNKRQKNYSIADIKINTDLKDPKAIMEEIEGLINE